MHLASHDVFLRALRAPAAIVDPAGRIHAVNAPWAEIAAAQALAGGGFGVGVDYPGRCAEAREDGPGEALARGLREVLAGKAPDFTLTYACGSAPARRHAEIVVSPLPTGEGEGTGALVVHRDFTPQQETEVALQETRQRLAQVLELLPEGYWDWNVDTDEAYYSDQWISSLGYTRDEIEPHARAWMQLLHPEDISLVMDTVSAYMEGRSATCVCENRLRRKDGTYRWDLERAQILSRDANGRVTRLMGFQLDISARKEAERVIQEQARRLMDLSTPLIPISDEVVVMPLIGVVDEERAEQVLSTLLRGITQSRARVAILDITGMDRLDAQVASTLVNAAKAVQLLGAQVVLTGVRPDVAKTLVDLDVDLGHVLLRGTLQSGILCAVDLVRNDRSHRVR
ncbi:PAS domain-containing protein [Chondromyces apiculatus]|uniref:RsbR, positive regulator of sigma-B n=1 Tax=Chondromyces apiculatus DSM 436 TaxID=1192034 RepID=A0A017TH82_9BACT|nr:PAS domain-containing protein [Chondromyces apiculatus]EYF08287.1 RsbR, positive regulator of sigma-B [Chondromyces apiculatus DSM 436]